MGVTVPRHFLISERSSCGTVRGAGQGSWLAEIEALLNLLAEAHHAGRGLATIIDSATVFAGVITAHSGDQRS